MPTEILAALEQTLLLELFLSHLVAVEVLEEQLQEGLLDLLFWQQIPVVQQPQMEAPEELDFRFQHTRPQCAEVLAAVLVVESAVEMLSLQVGQVVDLAF